MERIEFNKINYDPQIDYIKGLCILFVIWTHCISRDELGYVLFPYWGDTAVPIFLIIQIFHYYKKDVSLRMPNIIKLWKRILRPFIIMIVLMFLTQFLIYYNETDGEFALSLYWDKRGPGSYYIFIYLEMAFAIPLFTLLFGIKSNKWLFLIFVFLSQLVEYITCITQCPDYIYRILFLRYIFLIYIGYLLATKGLTMNVLTISAVLISIVFIYIFNYTNTNMEPLFVTSMCNWHNCHWICYIYIVWGGVFLLKRFYSFSVRMVKIRTYFENLGKYSFEIYLFQIFYYATISIYINKVLSFIGYYPIQHFLHIVLSTFICTLPVVYYKKYHFRHKTN